MSLPKLITVFFLLLLNYLSFGQDAANDRLKVFIDCSGSGCDENYLRTEINLVDFLNERSAADVHILITSLKTGGQTEQYQLIFYGQNSFGNHRDTLRFATKMNATNAEAREQLLQVIKLGLIPLISKTSAASLVSIQLKQTSEERKQAPARDKWNYVVFNVNAEGAISADQNYTNQRGTASITMNRTTDKSRFQLGAYGSQYIYTYKVSDVNGTQKYEVNNSDYSAFHFWVKALGQHWSLGYNTYLSNNTFRNTEAKWNFNPVVELNLFKYSEVNNRSFLLRYGPDFTYFKYYDTTLYNKTKENLFGHEVSLSINFNQKWGNFSTGAYYRNYLTDPGLYSTGGYVSLNVRVAGGLSFFVSGSGNIIHDQVYLLKGGATEQEILIRKRQLASSFDYYTSFGINFRFGSKLNNFVNQRIAGYRGF